VIALGAVVLGNLQAEKPAALQQQAAPTAKPGSLVAIADLHGDIQKARQALRLVSVVDSQGRWAAEGITVVQVTWTAGHAVQQHFEDSNAEIQFACTVTVQFYCLEFGAEGITHAP
jgi:hypothetical protein